MARRGKAPDTACHSQRLEVIPPPLWTPPTTPAARSPPQGTHARGTVPGPPARTHAPAALGPRIPTAQPEVGRLEEDERLASDAPHNGAGHPPRERTPATPTARNAGSQERTLWGGCWAPHAHTTRAQETRATGPGYPPQGTGSRDRDSAGHQTPAPHNGERSSPRGRPPSIPMARSPPQGMQAKGTVPGPTPARPRPPHMGSGPRLPASGRG